MSIQDEIIARGRLAIARYLSEEEEFELLNAPPMQVGCYFGAGYITTGEPK